MSESLSIMSILNLFTGLLGIIIGAFLTFIVQRKITKQVIEGDIKKIYTQFQTEFNFKSKQEWIIQVRNIISALVTETDSETEIKIDRLKILLLKNQLHLFLDSNQSEEKQVLILVDELYSIINIWQDELLECEHYNNWEEKKEYFESKDYPSQTAQIHREILNKTRNLLISKLS